MIDAIAFKFFISLTFSKVLQKNLIDVVITYLHESLDSDVYMKGLQDLRCLKIQLNDKRDIFNKLRQFLYGLKQLGQMWYNHLGEYFLKKNMKIISLVHALLQLDQNLVLPSLQYMLMF